MSVIPTGTNSSLELVETCFDETWLTDTFIAVVVRCSTFGTTPNTAIIRCQDVVWPRAFLNKKRKSNIILRSFERSNHKDITTCTNLSSITCITFNSLYIGYSSSISSSLVQYENNYQGEYTMTVMHIYNKYMYMGVSGSS